MSGMYRNPLADGAIRNNPCVCGSGKKVKKCHGQDYAVTGEQHGVIVEIIKGHNQRVREFEDALLSKAKDLANENKDQT